MMYKKWIPSNYAAVIDGSFALEEGLEKLCFHTCREKFARFFNETTEGFYMKHQTGQAEKIAAFLKKTEEILNLESKTSFGETSKGYITWVEPSPFWNTCRMRRSFFTMMLRTGMNHTDNYEQALLSNEYVNRTVKSVILFLCGHTQYTGKIVESLGEYDTCGWVWTFEGATEKKLKGLLAKP